MFESVNEIIVKNMRECFKDMDVWWNKSYLFEVNI